MSIDFRGGYKQGETKQIVLEAHALKLSVEETMRRSGKSYSAIYNAAMRNGFKLDSEDGRVRSGVVKSNLALAEKEGLSIIELSKRTGLKIRSLRIASSIYKIKLKKHFVYLKEQETKNGKAIQT